MTDMYSTERLEREAKEMFERCFREGLTPIEGVRILPEEGRGIGQFLFNASVTTLCEITKDPFKYLGGATKAEKARWTEEEREYADLYSLIQREFSNKKRKNVERIHDYVKDMLASRIIGFLPAPILWFQDEDIFVTEHFIGVKRTAYPHIIDGSTRIAALHKLRREASKEELQRLQSVKVPVMAIFGPDVDEDTAAQIFCDVNFMAIPVDPSVAKSMDTRDIHVRLSKEVEHSIEVLTNRVSKRRQLTATDTSLFTKYALFQSLRCFTDGVESLDKSFKSKVLTEENFTEVVDKALELWRDLQKLFGQAWLEEGARDKYLHIQAPVLKAISAFLSSAYFPTVDAAKRQDMLSFIGDIDWARDNQAWVGTLTKQGPRGMKMVNNDPVVRDLTKLLEHRDPRLPLQARAA